VVGQVVHLKDIKVLRGLFEGVQILPNDEHCKPRGCIKDRKNIRMRGDLTRFVKNTIPIYKESSSTRLTIGVESA